MVLVNSLKLANKKNSQRHELMEGFSSRIRYAMTLQRFNQSSLSRAIGITQPEISYYCHGKSFPRLWVIQKLALTLKVNYNWLKTGDGTHKTNSDKEIIAEFHKTFQERLIWLIWTNELKPIELSNKLGLSSTIVTHWCEGARFPNDESLNRLCEFFKVEKNWLVATEKELPFSFELAKSFFGMNETQYEEFLKIFENRLKI